MNVSPVGNLSAGDDVINAPSATALTGSTIIDNSSSDNDVINITLSSSGSPAPVIAKIENLKIDSYGGQLDFSNIAGQKNIMITGTGFTATKLGAAQTFTLSGVSGAQSYTTAAGTATDAITLNLAGTVTGAALTTADNDGGAIETVNLNVTSASTLALTTLTNTSTVNVTGAGVLTLNDNDATASTITAATSTGSLVYSQLAASNKALIGSAQADTFTQATTGNASVNGGAGNDTFNFGTFYTVDDSINGGAGTDTLNITDAGTVTLTNVSNVENIVLSGTTAALTFAPTNAAFGQTLSVNGSAMTGTLTTVALTGSDFFLNVTGSAQGDTLAGTNRADTINGGAGNDSITGGAGGDIINVGAGTDTVVLFAAGDTFSGVVTSGTTVLSGVDVISGMAAGDVLSLDAAVGIAATGSSITSVNTALMSAAGTVNAVAIVKGNYSTTTGIFTASTSGTDSLVQWDADGTGGSGAVESVVLVGFAGSLTAGANILTLA